MTRILEKVCRPQLVYSDMIHSTPESCYECGRALASGEAIRGEAEVFSDREGGVFGAHGWARNHYFAKVWMCRRCAKKARKDKSWRDFEDKNSSFARAVLLGLTIGILVLAFLFVTIR